MIPMFADSEVPGGLQVERENGSFVDVTPIEGTIVLNAGDLLSRCRLFFLSIF
jgi:isopenicillin N synthase-like dioxygenase